MRVINMLYGEGLARDERSATSSYGWGAAALAIVVVGAAVAVGGLAGWAAWTSYDSWFGLNQPRAFAPGEMEALNASRLGVYLIAFEAGSLATAVAAIAAFRRPGALLAPWAPPRGGYRAVLVSALALLAFAGLYGAFVYLFDSEALANDVRPFAGLVRSGGWPLLAIAAVIGAPIAEETLFRGFLYGVLAASPAGRRGAAIVTSALWAGLHASYSVYGLVAIFLIGLYLARMREKSGSLIPSLVCHSLYNAIVVAALALSPEEVLG